MPSEPFLTHSVLRDALAFGAAALLVAIADRRERRRVLRVVLLGMLGFGVHAAAHIAPEIGLPAAAPSLDITGRAIAAIAAVALAGTLFFDVLLPLVKMRPPRILRDLAIAAGSIAATLAVLSSGRVEVVGIVATSASEREMELAAVREGLSGDAMSMRVERSHPLTLAKIREFFRIG